MARLKITLAVLCLSFGFNLGANAIESADIQSKTLEEYFENRMKGKKAPSQESYSALLKKNGYHAKKEEAVKKVGNALGSHLDAISKTTAEQFKDAPKDSLDAAEGETSTASGGPKKPVEISRSIDDGQMSQVSSREAPDHSGNEAIDPSSVPLEIEYPGPAAGSGKNTQK